MPRGEQIDKVSKKYVKLSSKEKKAAKREHNKFLRKQAKDIENPNPQTNRYRGFIG